jgi:hypothetical protein
LPPKEHLRDVQIVEPANRAPTGGNATIQSPELRLFDNATPQGLEKIGMRVRDLLTRALPLTVENLELRLAHES